MRCPFAIACFANWVVAEERFLRALNAPLLKNKLPAHIRERMVRYKEAVEVSLTSRGRNVPEWLSAMA